jgi:AcrR family transcriptional regulator
VSQSKTERFSLIVSVSIAVQPAEPALSGEPTSRKEQQILIAAGALFMAQGYGATSMDAIAREAGVSKATLYARFRNKEDLFGAIIAAACRRHAESLSGPEIEHTDVGAALRRMARDFLTLLLSPQAGAIYRIVIAEGPRFPELGRIFYDSGPRRTLDRLASYLGRADERGLLRIAEPRVAAEQFAGMLKGDLHLRHLLGLAEAPNGAELDSLVDKAVGAFLRAYRSTAA